MHFRSWAFALIAALPCISVAAGADQSIVFSKDEIATIRDYYAQPHDAGNGQQKKQKDKPLPPGIAKNLERGKPLPPGIAKRRLPDDLTKHLPPVHDGYERVVVDDRVLLVETATQIIHDVLAGAVFR